MASRKRKEAKGGDMMTAKQESGSSAIRAGSGTVQPLLLSIPEVAESLRLSRAKVYRLIYYEGLPVVHFGRAVRVSVTALEEWIERREKGA